MEFEIDDKIKNAVDNYGGDTATLQEINEGDINDVYEDYRRVYKFKDNINWQGIYFSQNVIPKTTTKIKDVVQTDEGRYMQVEEKESFDDRLSMARMYNYGETLGHIHNAGEEFSTDSHYSKYIFREEFVRWGDARQQSNDSVSRITDAIKKRKEAKKQLEDKMLSSSEMKELEGSFTHRDFTLDNALFIDNANVLMTDFEYADLYYTDMELIKAAIDILRKNENISNVKTFFEGYKAQRDDFDVENIDKGMGAYARYLIYDTFPFNREDIQKYETKLILISERDEQLEILQQKWQKIRRAAIDSLNLTTQEEWEAKHYE